MNTVSRAVLLCSAMAIMFSAGCGIIHTGTSPVAIAIDGARNVWVVNRGSADITKLPLAL